jgi:hypothetical protein
MIKVLIYKLIAATCLNIPKVFYHAKMRHANSTRQQRIGGHLAILFHKDTTLRRNS